jgi:hypothetical protein
MAEIDPYTEAAILTPQEFELRGSGLAVPLRFKPDAAFLVRTVLAKESEFTRYDIVNTSGFKEVCEGADPVGRFAGVFSDIRFTLDALGSTLVQVTQKQGTRNIYRRNPAYRVIDERP